MNDRKSNKIHRVSKKQADAFFVLAFQPVDLASTEQCCNSHHLLLLLDPQTGLTYVQVLKFRLKPSLNGRRSVAFEADDDNQHISSLC